MDEATSSLDSESEKYIQDAMDEVMKNKTEHNKPQIDWDKARYVPV